MPVHTSHKPLPQDVRDRLGKLLPLLSSDQAGECAAAAAAITRLLRASGLDWHDLVGALSNPGAGAHRPPPPPPPPPKPPPEPPPGSHRSRDILGAIAGIRANHPGLNERSIEFLDSLEARAGHYSTAVYLSPKQLKWFTDLLKQAGLL